MGWDFKNCFDQCKSSGELIARGYFSSDSISKTVPTLFKILCQYNLNKNPNNFMVWKVKISRIFFRFLAFFLIKAGKVLEIEPNTKCACVINFPLLWMGLSLRKNSFKILGLTFSSNLDWGSYIISITKTYKVSFS